MAELHYIVIRQEQIGALQSSGSGQRIDDLDAALRVAEEKTASDGEPRYVAQLMFHTIVDPKPAVITTRLHGEAEVAGA